MLTGRYEAIPGAGELTTPTTGESMAASFKSNYLQPFLLTPGMEDDKRKEMAERTTALRTESDRSQGMVQRSANWIAGQAGSILNPFSLMAGGIGGLVAKPLIRLGAGLIGRYLPSESAALLSKPLSEAISKKLPQTIGAESAASLTGKAVSGYSMLTGFSLPGDIANTYNPKTDQFNWHGGIKAAFEDGGVGLTLMAAPYLAGSIWGKLFGKAADHTQMPLPGEKVEGFTESHIDDAIASKRLSPQQGQWLKDYVFQGDTNENVAKRATEMLIQDGHPVDSATNKVLFKILKPEDVSNLQTAVSDRMASDLPENIKPLYQDFINHSRMDDMRADPNVESTMDGLSGVVSFVRKRLENAPQEIEVLKKQLTQLLPNDLNHEKEDSFFSQKSILKNMKKVGNEESHVQQLPITIPENVLRHVKIKEKISKLKENLKVEKQSRPSIPKIETKIVTNTVSPHQFYIKSEYGSIDLIKHGDELKVSGVSIYQSVFKKGSKFETESPRGKGYGKNLYKAAIEYAESKGLKFVSDQKVSPEAMRVYKSLEKSGYRFKKNPTTYLETKSQRERDHYSVTNAKPVFELISSPKSNKQTLRRIEELESKLPKIMTMKQEMAHLRDKLLSKVKEDNFKLSPEYRRLLDLTHVRKDARELFHELNLRNEHELHEAYATVIDTITKVMRSEFGKLAKTENINDYMRERIQASVPEFKNLEISAVKKEVAEAKVKMVKAYEETKTPEARDAALKALDEEISESESKENRDEYEVIKNQLDEFKENENVFSNLIKCVLGARNV